MRRTVVTTDHTFTLGTYRSVFELVPADPEVGIRHVGWELLSLTDEAGVEVDEEVLSAALCAVGEEFSPEGLVELLWTEAEDRGDVSRAAA